MSLPVNPAKVLRLFAPIWLVLALSLWLHWSGWQSKLILLGVLGCLPVVAAIVAGLLRGRWRLELTPAALVHHTLSGAERFAWERMGPLQIKGAPVLSALCVRTFWFAYPLDAPRAFNERASKGFGRRILCVFGDHSAAETIKQIEEWRRLFARPSGL